MCSFACARARAFACACACACVCVCVCVYVCLECRYVLRTFMHLYIYMSQL